MNKRENVNILAIREMQIKWFWDFILHVKMSKIKTQVIACANKDIEQGEHFSIAGWSENLYSYFGSQHVGFSGGKAKY